MNAIERATIDAALRKECAAHAVQAAEWQRLAVAAARSMRAAYAAAVAAGATDLALRDAWEAARRAEQAADHATNWAGVCAAAAGTAPAY